MSNIALNTNVLIDLHDNSAPNKRSIAKDLLSDNPFISSQVISEYLNVTRRLLPLPKEDVLIQASSLFSECTIVPVLPVTLLFASKLVAKYNYSYLTLLLWQRRLKTIAQFYIRKICITALLLRSN